MTQDIPLFDQYKLITNLFFDQRYEAFDEKVKTFKKTSSYANFETDWKLDLEYYLAASRYRRSHYKDALKKILQLRKSKLADEMNQALKVRLQTLEAEILMKLERYEKAQEMFARALEMVNDTYSFQDLSYRWEEALDELELKYRKPSFLEQMQRRWKELQELF